MNKDDFNRRFLEKGRELYEAGNKSEILHCLNHCCWNKVPIPGWLRRALLDAYSAARWSKSWDEVFGKPVKKGARLATQRRNVKIQYPVFERVCERHKAGEAIDKALFDAVGKEFGIGGTVASELYYWVVKCISQPIEEYEEDIINRTF